jgi:hypothetical protein
MSLWTIEVVGTSFSKFLSSMPPYEQSVIAAAVKHVLSVEGIGICSGEWGKPLGGGLYEFRIRKSLHAIQSISHTSSANKATSHSQQPVLIRIFCAFHGDKIVVIHHGYDKKRDPSHKRQQREIRTARKLHHEWKQGLNK